MSIRRKIVYIITIIVIIGELIFLGIFFINRKNNQNFNSTNSNNSIPTLVENNEKDNNTEISTNSISDTISLFDLNPYTLIDYSEDFNNRDYSSYDKYFKVLRISRIQPKENKEKYPEFLYIYEIQGQKTWDKTTSQYAYISLDKLLSDISWVGIRYSYIKKPNTYEKSTDYDHMPSPINGVSEKEYEDIKNGKYSNVQITEENSTTNNINSENNEQNNNEQISNEYDATENDANPLEEYLKEQEGILVKTYNTIKIESEADYHIIEIYKHNDNKYSYCSYWHIYDENLPSRNSTERFDTIEEALNDWTKKGEMKVSISDLTEQ